MFLILTVIILGITFLINGFLFWLTYRSQAVSSTLKLIFRIHIASIAAWAFFILVLLVTAAEYNFPIYYSGDIGYVLAQIVFVAATLLFITNYWFVQYFIWERFRYVVLNYVVITLQVVTLCLCVAANALYSSITVEQAGYVSLDILPYHNIYSLFLLVHLTVPLWLLFWYGKRELNSIRQKQYQTLFISYLIFLITSMTFNWVLPVYFDIFNFNAYGPTMSLILVAGILYAIMRHQFLDIRVIVQRSLVYTLLFGIVVAFYLGTVALIGIIAQPTLQITAFTAGAITTIVGIFTVPTIDYYLRKFTHPLFFKGQFDYSETLYSLSEMLHQTLQVEKIITTTTSQLQALFGASYVAILLTDEQKQDTSSYALSFALNTGNGNKGILLLGEKRSGDTYTRRDRQMLSTLVHQIAIAIERAQFYEEVREYSEQLEAKVADRTAELEALQGYQRQMLDELSHGLQIPLTNIINELEMLQFSQQSHVTPFREAVDSLSEFINRLLQLSRLEAPNNEWCRSHINLSNMLAEIIEYCEISFQSMDVRLKSIIEPNVYIDGDKKKLTEMLHILLHNAVTYRDPNRQQCVTLTLNINQTKAVIRVSDTGLGIAKEYQKHIFKRFYRVHNGVKPNIGGSGLGLTIAETIIHGHQGTIIVDSNIGKGTVFTVMLPIV